MLLIVGEIVRPHGVRGEVVVDIRTDEPAQRFVPGSVLVTDPGGVLSGARGTHARPAAGELPAGAWKPPPTLTIEWAKQHQGRYIIQFEGIHDRELAEALRRVVLCVDSADVPPPEDPEEFHDHQLIGLTAVDGAGEKLGEVVRIDHAPASDLLVLRRPDGSMGLVPFVQAIVPTVDIAAGRVVVNPPDGLFDL
jgi:16S rRNA processing protein RimM